MKVTEMRALSSQAREEAVQAAYKELFQLRVRKASGQAEGMLHKSKQIRKQIAQLLTVAKEQEVK